MKRIDDIKTSKDYKELLRFIEEQAKKGDRSITLSSVFCKDDFVDALWSDGFTTFSYEGHILIRW